MLANLDISALAIPDFVAGFVYGLTGDNQLTEIEACYQGGEVMATEIEAGIADIKVGGTDHDIQAGLQFALAATQIPVALNTCKGMGDDLTAIEQWAAIFKDPAKLAKKLALHYAVHKAEIKTDVGNLEADWDAADYFKAGEDLADIATLAIGPIQTADYTVGTLDCQLSDSKDADFLAGFIAEFTGNDHKAYFETCYHDSDAFKADICTAVNAFSTKDGQQVLVGVKTILADMPELSGFLAACPDAAADIAVVNNWMHYWRNAGEMAVYQTAYKNIVPNMKAIVADADQASADYAKGDWYQVAFTAGTIARTALPIMTGALGDDFDCGLTDIVVADLMAGFMMEMPGSSGVSHQAYMEGCFKSSPAFLTDMCAVANDFATKDNQKVLEGIQKVLGDFPQIHTSMSACPEAMPDWTLVGNWFKYWKAQGEMKVYQAAYTNFTHNMATIEADFNTVSADFSAKDFFGAGRAANWGSVLVLPPPAAEVLQ